MDNNIIAVFTNRNKSMQFASTLKRLGIPNKTINTPRELSVSCGLSVVFKSMYLNKVREVVYRLSLGNSIRLYLFNGSPVKNYTSIYWHTLTKV